VIGEVTGANRAIEIENGAHRRLREVAVVTLTLSESAHREERAPAKAKSEVGGEVGKGDKF